jgi:hypothetical protein
MNKTANTHQDDQDDKTIMAAADLMYLDSLFQGPEQTSSIPQPDQPTFNANCSTLNFFHDCGPEEWKFGDEEDTICLASPHVEAYRPLATDTPFLPVLANHLPSNDYSSWSSDTTEQDFNYEPEEDECSWLELAKLLDIFFGENASQSSTLWIASAGQRTRSRTSTEDLSGYTTENTTRDTSALASSTLTTLTTSSPCTEGGQDPLTIPESQHSETVSSTTFSREAMQDIEVIDLTGDDAYTSLEPVNSPKPHLPNNTLTQQLHFVDLTQDDTDDADDNNDDDEKTKTWYNDYRDAINYGHRSPYENNYDTSSPISDLSYRKPSNFIVTDIIQNEKRYPWDHRCKRYRNGDSYATPNHEDTILVIRDGGSDIPIELKYEGFGIWEGCNYRIGAAISDIAAETMVFQRQSFGSKCPIPRG